MITLEELWDYYEKGLCHLRVDVYGLSPEINFPRGLPDKIAKRLIKEKRVAVQSADDIHTKNFLFEGLSVYAEKGVFHSKISIEFPKTGEFACPKGLSKKTLKN